MLGVRPNGAGYQTVDICPQLGDLAWAEGDVPTPKGVIHVRVERRNEGGLAAVIRLPSGISARMMLAGKTLQADQGGTYQLAAP